MARSIAGELGEHGADVQWTCRVGEGDQRSGLCLGLGEVFSPGPDPLAVGDRRGVVVPALPQ